MGMPASTKPTKRWTADEARALTAANPRPLGASEAFVLELEAFFAAAHGEQPPPGT